MITTRDRADAAGFTLLELIVALTLTSLILLVIYTSLRLTLQGMQRGQAAADNLQELRVGQAILERSVSSTVLGSMGNRQYFIGTPQEMRFFTAVPLEAASLGGVYHWRLLVGKDEANQGVLAVEQTKNVNWRRDPEGVEVRQIILRQVTSAHFSYGQGDAVSDTWDAKKSRTLPHWVKINLTLKGHQPVVMLIALHAAE